MIAASTAVLWLPALAAGTALGITALNAMTWTRGTVAHTVQRRWIALVPARNEAANIEACVRALFAASPAPVGVLVYDDGSTDQTPEILQRLCREYAGLRVENGVGLPAGWVGKPHACHQLAQRARAIWPDADVLLFVDADVRLHADGLTRLASLLESDGTDLVTAVPRQETQTWAEQLILPVLHLTYLSWLPLALIPRTQDPRVLAANGQLLAISCAAYDAIGGFAAVRDALVDDMALCRAAKEKHLRVVFADGHHMGTCRMYRDARTVWEGFSKNLYIGIGGTPWAWFAVVSLYAFTFLAGWVAAPVAWLRADATPFLVAVGLNVAQRLWISVRHAQPISAAVTHPLSIVGFIAVATNAMRWALQGRVRWSGRTYTATGAAREPHTSRVASPTEAVTP